MTALINPALINIFWLFCIAIGGLILMHWKDVTATYSKLAVRNKYLIHIVAALTVTFVLMHLHGGQW